MFLVNKPGIGQGFAKCLPSVYQELLQGDEGLYCPEIVTLNYERKRDERERRKESFEKL